MSERLEPVRKPHRWTEIRSGDLKVHYETCDRCGATRDIICEEEER